MARRLVEAGVNLVQVNLGNNETWDTHGNAFPHLKDKLFPPTDRAVSALLDDLHESGLLDSTLIVMAGEFGRTPQDLARCRSTTSCPGRDHWGAVQTVFFAGGGVAGGRVVGSSDKIGGYPAADPQTPENMAATIYQSPRHPPHGRVARRGGPAALHLPRRADRGAGLTRRHAPRARSDPREETATCRKERGRWRYLGHLGANG